MPRNRGDVSPYNADKDYASEVVFERELRKELVCFSLSCRG
jgi:hypothetical protein